MKLFYDGLMRKLRRRTPEPHDGYRSAWAAQIEAMRTENEMLRRKNVKRKRQGFVPLVPGVALLLFGAVSGAGGVLAGVFLSTHLPLFADGRRVIQLDEIHIVGVAPVEIDAPTSEVCNGIDDDHDGVADEEVCMCTPGAYRSCTTILPGVCSAGTQTCVANGRGWGACLAYNAPSADLCGDGVDNDCDGVTDENCTLD